MKFYVQNCTTFRSKFDIYNSESYLLTVGIFCLSYFRVEIFVLFNQNIFALFNKMFEIE